MHASLACSSPAEGGAAVCGPGLGGPGAGGQSRVRAGEDASSAGHRGRSALREVPLAVGGHSCPDREPRGGLGRRYELPKDSARGLTGLSAGARIAIRPACAGGDGSPARSDEAVYGGSEDEDGGQL
eukprot:10540386-Alexandrium_andersonii.AAC.1